MSNEDKIFTCERSHKGAFQHVMNVSKRVTSHEQYLIGLECWGGAFMIMSEKLRCDINYTTT